MVSKQTNRCRAAHKKMYQKQSEREYYVPKLIVDMSWPSSGMIDDEEDSQRIAMQEITSARDYLLSKASER